MDQMNTEQIVAVLGHELGHWKHWHFVFNLIKMEVQMFFMFFICGVLFNEVEIYKAFGFKEMIPIIGFELIGKLFVPIAALQKFLMNWHTRVCEYQADEFAVKLGYGEQLKSGLLVLSEENKKEMNPDWLFATLNYSHPAM